MQLTSKERYSAIGRWKVEHSLPSAARHHPQEKNEKFLAVFCEYVIKALPHVPRHGRPRGKSPMEAVAKP